MKFCTTCLLLGLAACSSAELGGTGPGMSVGSGGAGTAAGGSVALDPTASGGTALISTGGTSAVDACATASTPLIGPTSLRRLTRFEYNKTVASLLGDTEESGNSLPPELLGNGFGNDAEAQPVSSFLVEQFGIIAADLASRAVENPSTMSRFAPCWSQMTAATRADCTTTFLKNFLAEAFRRPVESTEVDDYLSLQQDLEQQSDFDTSIVSVIETALQSPDFLYRVEMGENANDGSNLRKPTGFEMATRLSYFFWGAPPDEMLRAAALEGSLASPEGIRTQASRLLEDPRSREVIRFFFGKFLPVNGLTDLARDKEQYPTFSPQIGALMLQETETFLEHEIFEGPGDWPSALTAPYTFVNGPLAEYYGMSGVSGPAFQKVETDPSQRKGLLTQGSVLTGSTVSNFTNPVRRGLFLLRNVMCLELPEPPEALAGSIMPPDPYSGATGRERYSAHSGSPACANCHAIMDPPGFALENYDAVGLWRDQENGVTIDASGEIRVLPQPFSGPMELIDQIAASEQTQSCFAQKWLSFAEGRTLSEEDECLVHELSERFASTGYNVKQLLLEITQSDSFRYLPPSEVQ